MREMKGVNVSCTSPSSFSTDTTSSINHNSILMTSAIGGRSIDRCSPHLTDPLRAKTLSQALPNKPKNSNQKAKKPAPDNKRSTQVNITDPASSRRYLLGNGNAEDFLEQQSVDFATADEPTLTFQSSKVEELLDAVEEYPSRFQGVKFEESKDISLPPPSSSTTKRSQEQQQVCICSSLRENFKQKITAVQKLRFRPNKYARVLMINFKFPSILLWVEEQHPSNFQSVKVEETKDENLPAAASSPKKAQEQQVVVLRVSLHCRAVKGK